MRTLLRFVGLALSLSFVVMFAACGDDEQTTTPPEDNAPVISLLTPNGAEAVTPGSDYEITWEVTDDGTVTVDLFYEAQGLSEQTIAEDLEGTSYTWTVPSTSSYQVTVKAVATDDAGQSGEDTSDQVFAIVSASARGYVTASECGNCHVENYNKLFQQSGHPYKLNKVVNGNPPTYPNSTVPMPPTGYTWDDITYVIGGYGWKARFMDENGYILVTGLLNEPTQYNVPRPDLGAGLPPEWVDYHASDTEPKPYTCGSCHTTGWQTTADNGGVNQDGLVGIFGTWEETGIRCEQCHGPGVDPTQTGGGHVVSGNPDEIRRDASAELCGTCHFRDTNHNILASGGFIRHHEQYDELIGGGKATFDCSTCHDPHIGVRYNNPGIVMECESCHTGVTLDHLPGPECEDCHMGRASKSARKVHEYEGDIRTHIFTINTNPFPKDSMFFLDPTSGNTHTRNFITLDIACYTCHDDGAGNGGTINDTKTLAELSAKADGIHQ